MGAMQGQAHAVLDVAWDAGIRYFDAARSYGEAEQFLGSWLIARNIAPEAVTVGSKWGYTYTAEWQVDAPKHEVKDHSLSVLQRQWAESRLRLGSHIDLYQIHSTTIESGVLEDRAVTTELAGLKQQGICIGLSLSGPGQAATLQRAMTVTVDGVRLFDAVQATWNLLETCATSALSEARQAGMGVIIKEALANGRLTERNIDPSFADKRALLQSEATRLNMTLDALSLAAALAQPWADVVLSGAATVDHLQSNLKALSVAWDEEAAPRLAALAEPSPLYWQTRAHLAWN
jgi:aryl-alcohol dehydrogenase-like predicted oxidoreductase